MINENELKLLSRILWKYKLTWLVVRPIFHVSVCIVSFIALINAMINEIFFAAVISYVGVAVSFIYCATRLCKYGFSLSRYVQVKLNESELSAKHVDLITYYFTTDSLKELQYWLETRGLSFGSLYSFKVRMTELMKERKRQLQKEEIWAKFHKEK